jgi:hypothetical protein
MDTTLDHLPARRPRAVQALALIVPLLLVSLLVLGNSRAAFTGETRTDAQWGTAEVVLSNDAPSGLEFATGGALVPGDVVSETVTVTYDGSAASVDVVLFGDDLVHDKNLANALTLTISSDGDTWTGTLAEFASNGTDLTWSDVGPEEDRTYDIEVKLPTAAGDEVSGASASVAFVWEAATNATQGQD